ncbi:MAG: sensor histidine kinase [Burkholderiaceae bacterium]
MQFQHLLTASRFLTPAAAFRSPSDERSFRADYIRGGYGFATAVMLVGTLMAFAFMTIAALQPIDGSNAASLQMLRLLIGSTCLASFLALITAPEWSLRHHAVTVFVPSLVALTGLGLLLFVPRPEDVSLIAFGRTTISLIIAIWLISAFCRLPLYQVMAMSLIASLLNLIGLQQMDVTHLPFFALDLVIANFTVWALTIQIEKRERLLWFQASRDRRALQRAESDANRATVISQAQTRLMQAVGHDVRQPLSSGSIYLSLMGGEARESANRVIQHQVEKLSACLRAVESTVTRLLDSPVSLGHDQDLSTTRTTLTGVFQDLRHVFEPQAERYGIDLRFTSLCNTPHPVRTNEIALLEILNNLISNAIKYSSIDTTRRGAVVVGVVSIGDAVRIDIVDNGVGIDEALHSQVFEEHYRVPHSANQVPGAGLGLSIVESMIQRLPDHRLRLCSQPGIGTRIQLYLPGA